MKKQGEKERERERERDGALPQCDSSWLEQNRNVCLIARGSLCE